jgi:hypothetical protein
MRKGLKKEEIKTEFWKGNLLESATLKIEEVGIH